MSYCSKCGTQLVDGAKFCPKCGNAVGMGDIRYSRPNKMVNKRPKIENKSLTIALGISAISAFIGLCGGIISASDGVWSILLVSICASAAIICVTIGEIDNKYAWGVAIGSFIAIFVAIGSSAPATNKEFTPTKEKHFKELLPSNGSESFIIEGCKPIGDDGLIVKSIEFFEKNDGDMYFFTTKGRKVHSDVEYDINKPTYLIFGREDKGLPERLLFDNPEKCVRIPMRQTLRSLNLSNSAAIAAYEVLRQWDYALLSRCGQLTQYKWEDTGEVP